MAGTRGNIGTVLLTSAMLAMSSLVPIAGLTAPAQAAPAAAVQPQPPTLEDFKTTLSNFGQFIYSERYGNVWQPTSLPAGWHPYPACHWVYDRTYGWTYDDPTAWGKIVHHYGRWAHDDQAGWVWIPGTEWAPAWVIWRSGGDWTGWAPTPPNSDQQEITLASFNADKQWTFIETAKLANRCDAEPAAAPAAAFSGSAPVTSIRVVRGIAVYVLPPPATLIDYDTGPVIAWKPDFLGEWLLWLNTAASAAAVNIGPGHAAVCPPAVAPAAAPYISTPPPPPQGQKPLKRRATRKDYQPPRQGRPPVLVQEGPAYEPPPVYVDPPVRRRPADWVPPYVRPRPYPRPRPVLTPQNYPDRPYYPRSPRRIPGPYDEPLIR
ncbi:DUF6600 domain-containing protein [Labrys okinawensis]|uniref:DUF6600 domain-containing protein n=1 Tax=Labrys okinawensis TaxID=346911 RepID=UPI0039BCA654